MKLHLPRLKKMVGELLLPPPPARSQTTGELPLPPRLNLLLQLELLLRFTLVDSPCSVVKEPPRSTFPPLDLKLKVPHPGSSRLIWLLSPTVMVMAMVILLRG